jgi:hypothetical protein
VKRTREGRKNEPAERSEAEKHLKTEKRFLQTISAKAGETGVAHGNRMSHDGKASSGLSPSIPRVEWSGNERARRRLNVADGSEMQRN